MSKPIKVVIVVVVIVVVVFVVAVVAVVVVFAKEVWENKLNIMIDIFINADNRRCEDELTEISLLNLETAKTKKIMCNTKILWTDITVWYRGRPTDRCKAAGDWSGSWEEQLPLQQDPTW